jgi:hypothetical protein
MHVTPAFGACEIVGLLHGQTKGLQFKSKTETNRPSMRGSGLFFVSKDPAPFQHPVDGFFVFLSFCLATFCQTL